jgi:hypothetical protein
MSLFFKDFIYLDDLRSLELNDQNRKKSYSFFLKKTNTTLRSDFKPKFFEDLKKLTRILFSQKMIYFENRMKFRILFEDGNILQIKLRENSTGSSFDLFSHTGSSFNLFSHTGLTSFL